MIGSLFCVLYLWILDHKIKNSCIISETISMYMENYIGNLVMFLCFIKICKILGDMETKLFCRIRELTANPHFQERKKYGSKKKEKNFFLLMASGRLKKDSRIFHFHVPCLKASMKTFFKSLCWDINHAKFCWRKVFYFILSVKILNTRFMFHPYQVMARRGATSSTALRTL